MITKALAERYRDSYEKGMNIDDYVEFFQDCQKAAPQDKTLASLTDAQLRELAAQIIDMNQEANT